jgi:poly(A) polymerase
MTRPRSRPADSRRPASKGSRGPAARARSAPAHKRSESSTDRSDDGRPGEERPDVGRFEADRSGGEDGFDAPRAPRRRARNDDGGTRLPATQIDPTALDRDARRVVSRLQAQGHEAYFVGGCVRDLLIGRRPKDFDVATDATPQEIKRLFRNGRIIGRRFRLVHVYYGDHVIETSTFRAAPRATTGDEDEDLLIIEDNEYGSAREDAQRRDFTVNALFFDPTAHELVDHVSGLADIERRVLRTIGDPQVRLAEDPVRILRAIKFSTRLDFEIDDATWDAMCDLSPHLERSAPPRVLEEILRLLRSGTALGAVQLMRDCGALEVLLPWLDDYLGGEEEDPDRAEPFWHLLAALDGFVQHAQSEPSTALLLAALFVHPFEARLGDPATLEDPLRDPQRAAWDVLAPVAERARLSRRDLNGARRILTAQPRFTHPPDRFSPVLFARAEEFPDALELFALRAQARGVGRDQVEAWRERHARAFDTPADEVEAERRRTRGRRRRKRRRQG